MKRSLQFMCMLFFVSQHVFSQGIGIGTTAPDASAVLDITHTSKGVLIPRMNAASMNAISSPAKGLLVYDSLLNQLMINMGSAVAPNWQPIIAGNTGWRLAGNNGVNSNIQFIGTTDNQPVHFRINNVQAGELHPLTGNIFWGMRAGQTNATGLNNIAIGTDALKFNAGSSRLIAIGDSALFNNSNNNATPDVLGIANVAIGSKALFSNTVGNSNTATGNSSLFFNTTGHDNTAAGDHSLFNNTIGFDNTAHGTGALQGNTSGAYNTATGAEALFSNTTGFVNTAIGYAALFSNTTGSWNTAIGEYTLHDNTKGVNNTAIGNFALQFDSTGSQNTAVGVQALKLNTTGINNVALGVQTLFSNTTGYSNTGLGNFSLQNITTGHDNIAAGINALINNATGVNNAAFGNFAGDLATADNNNTFIGYGANNTSGLALSNSTALGFASTVTASNQVRFGNGSTTSIGGVVGYTTLSDGRFKKDIQENVKGIDFIMKLRPVTYHLDIAAVNNKLNRKGKTGGQEANAAGENTTATFSGFIAQEVEQAARDAGYDFSGIDKPKNENDFYGLRYADFVVPLIKAVQEQQQLIDKLRQANANQRRLSKELLKRIETLESSLKQKTNR